MNRVRITTAVAEVLAVLLADPSAQRYGLELMRGTERYGRTGTGSILSVGFRWKLRIRQAETTILARTRSTTTTATSQGA
jgi:hypothetical protein